MLKPQWIYCLAMINKTLKRLKAKMKQRIFFINFLKNIFLRPKVAINYKRLAYFSELYPKLRVTIDQSIEASLDVSLHAKKSSFVNILSPRYTLIEFKYDGQLPKLLSSIIRAHELKMLLFPNIVMRWKLLMRQRAQSRNINIISTYQP